MHPRVVKATSSPLQVTTGEWLLLNLYYLLGVWADKILCMLTLSMPGLYLQPPH
jgi:hypothetical protein